MRSSLTSGMRMLAEAAGQDDFAAGLAERDAVLVGFKLASQPAHGGPDGVVLHTGLGLPAPFAVRVGLAVWAILVSETSLRLCREVGVEVDELDFLAELGIRPLGVGVEPVVTIGYKPPLGV